MTVIDSGNGIYAGLAADTKPTTGITTGSRFFETDTGMTWYWNGTVWGTAKFMLPAPNVMRIGWVDCGTAAAASAFGLFGGGTNLNKLAGGGTAALLIATSTEGQALQYATTASATGVAGWGQANTFAVPTANVYLRCRFKLEQSTTANARFWFGVVNSASNPTTDTPLASLHGMLFGFPVGATNYTIIQNNASTNAYDNLASTASFPTNAPDTNWHTVELYTTDNGSHWSYSLDSATPFTLSTTQLPGVGIRCAVYAIMSNNANAVSQLWDCQYGFISMSPNNK